MKTYRFTVNVDSNNKVLDGDYTNRDRAVTAVFGVSGFVLERYVDGAWTVLDTCSGFWATAEADELLGYCDARDLPDDDDAIEMVDLRPAELWDWEFKGLNADEFPAKDKKHDAMLIEATHAAAGAYQDAYGATLAGDDLQRLNNLLTTFFADLAESEAA